jgi:hypothetical protein
MSWSLVFILDKSFLSFPFRSCLVTKVVTSFQGSYPRFEGLIRLRTPISYFVIGGKDWQVLRDGGGTLPVYLTLAAHAHDRCAHVHVDYLGSSKEQVRHAPRNDSWKLFLPRDAPLALNVMF